VEPALEVKVAVASAIKFVDIRKENIMEITFLPDNIKVSIGEKENVLSAAVRAGVNIEASCGGRGTCGKCKVLVTSNGISDVSEEEIRYLSSEEILNGVRLACKLYAKENLIVETIAVEKNKVRKSIITQLPVNFIMKPRIGMITGNEDSIDLPNAYGIAFDIGTTSVAGMLWNLRTQEQISATAKVNTQRVHGADVISRIQYSLSGSNNQFELKKMIISCLDTIMEELLNQKNITKEELHDIVIVGNTTMSHLFLGEPIQGLAKSPFHPGFTGKVVRNAIEFFNDLKKHTRLLVLPNIGGHVGSDITAGILAVELDSKKDVTVFIDIGTNGEIVLKDKEKMYACSTAAGPAFEGASIHAGMRAEEGAIESVKLINNRLDIKVIGGKKPKGICGSGLIDSIAELLNAGVIDDTGRILDKKTLRQNHVDTYFIDRIIETDRGNDFILSIDKEGKDIRLLQKDIREVQMAKAAICGGILTMLKRINKNVEDINELIVAGAFGNYIKKESAIRIGLLPNICLEKIIMAGNTASLGASMVLLSEEYEKRAENIVTGIEHIELANDMDFMDIYIEAMNF
jgi:uncharacterized 2Fe-2S/4Fe-4S cluster protein (DUF4445 family)